MGTREDRRYDLDWLRVMAMLNIFLFPSGRFFSCEDWSVKNDQLSQGFSIFIDIVARCIMPLFFIISAQSSYYSLGLWPAFPRSCRRDACTTIHETLRWQLAGSPPRSARPASRPLLHPAFTMMRIDRGQPLAGSGCRRTRD